MALCKCKTCPRQGKFQVGKYYNWYIAPGQLAPRENATMPIKYILPDNLCVKGVHDDDNKFIHFSPLQYPLFFKDIQHANISISVYIDRKNELLFAPVFTDEKGFGAKLSYFTNLPMPYTEEQIGREFFMVWEEYKDHPIVSAKEKEQAIPYYKIVTKGKGYVTLNNSCYAAEVGIGGGQATLPILKTGCNLTAVEYGKEFSASAFHCFCKKCRKENWMFEQDYVMRLIKEMIRVILKLLFNIDIETPTTGLIENEGEKQH